MRQPVQEEKAAEVVASDNPVDVAFRYIMDAVRLLHPPEDGQKQDEELELNIKIEFSEGTWSLDIEDEDQTLEQSEGKTLSEAITKMLTELSPKVRGIELKLSDLDSAREKVRKAWEINWEGRE